MIEPRTGDHDAEAAHVGEVGQAHPPWRVLLAEDHIPAGAVESPPFANAALQGPAHPCDDLGVPTPNLFEDGHRTDAGRGFQHRHDLAVPHPRERVGATAPAGLLFLRR